MAYQPNPNDPYRAGLSDEEIRHQARLNSLDNELQADPTLAEGSRQRRQGRHVRRRHRGGAGRPVLWPE